MSTYAGSMSEISPSIMAVVKAVKDGTAFTELNDFAYNLWNIQGYVQGATLGQPTGSESLSLANPGEMALQTQLAELQCLEDLKEESFAAGPQAAAINPIQIIQLAQMVLTLLKSLGVFDKNTDK